VKLFHFDVEGVESFAVKMHNTRNRTLILLAVFGADGCSHLDVNLFTTSDLDATTDLWLNECAVYIKLHFFPSHQMPKEFALFSQLNGVGRSAKA
jgi:hypothetical protein